MKSYLDEPESTGKAAISLDRTRALELDRIAKPR